MVSAVTSRLLVIAIALALPGCDKPEVQCEHARKRAHDEWTKVVSRTKERMRRPEPQREPPEVMERLLVVLEAAEHARDRASASAFMAHETSLTAEAVVGDDGIVDLDGARAASEAAWSLCKDLPR